VMAKEILGFHLLTTHNLFQVAELVSRIRAAVEEGRLSGLLGELRDPEGG
jgi:tRNA-guanine family transglycosylase